MRLDGRGWGGVGWDGLEWDGEGREGKGTGTGGEGMKYLMLSTSSSYFPNVVLRKNHGKCCHAVSSSSTVPYRIASCRVISRSVTRDVNRNFTVGGRVVGRCHNEMGWGENPFTYCYILFF